MSLTPVPPDETPSNIVGINGDAIDILRKKHESHQFPCGGIHKKVVVDGVKRTLECQACGYVIDAFDFVHMWAIEGDRKMSGLRDVEVQRRILQNECDDLKRQIANMRQQLKRGGRPQDPKERFEYEQQRLNPSRIRPIELSGNPG